MKVKPKRWWSRKDRRCAKIATAVLEAEYKSRDENRGTLWDAPFVDVGGPAITQAELDRAVKQAYEHFSRS